MGRKDTLLSIKKCVAVFLVLAMLLALAGCVRYSVGCTVNSDGTVNLTYLYALSDFSDGNGYDGWEAEKKNFESKGWSTRDYTGDGSSDSSSYNGFIAAKGAIPIDQVEAEVRALGEGFESFTFTCDDGVYTLDWDTESHLRLLLPHRRNTGSFPYREHIGHTDPQRHYIPRTYRHR